MSREGLKVGRLQRRKEDKTGKKQGFDALKEVREQNRTHTHTLAQINRIVLPHCNSNSGFSSFWLSFRFGEIREPSKVEQGYKKGTVVVVFFLFFFLGLKHSSGNH